MMCIIRIVDGAPFEHPIILDNFKEAFPDVDLNNLPEGFAWFERKERPPIDLENEVFVTGHSEYVFDGTVWTEVWKVRDKTFEEKQEVYLQMYENFQHYVLSEKSRAETPEDAAVWQAAHDQAGEYLKETPLVPRVLIPPRKLEDGTWITTFSSGSAPSVIG